jgi:hypothetical protein
MKRNRVNRKVTVLNCALIALLIVYSLAMAESPSKVEVGRFSTEKAGNSLPLHWEPLSFKNIKRHTHYRVVKKDGQIVVKAMANASASGLMRKIPIDPKEYPIVQWSWKALNVLKKGNVYRKDGDDYPARVYIVFEYEPDRVGFSERVKYEAARMLYGEYPPMASISYIWASNAPKGLIVPNPYTERSMMIVVESGGKNLNAWVGEKRNIHEDFWKAFRYEPPMISGVAIMTDTDNTGETATTYYGDILFKKE